MTRWLVALPIWALSVSVAAQDSSADRRYRLDPVHISNPLDPASSGNGVRFQVQGRCATITAAHVVENIAEPELVPLRGALGAARVVKSVRRFDTAVVWQNHRDTAFCGTLPEAETVRAAIQSGGKREVWLVDAGGGQQAVDVDLVSSNSFDLTLKLSPSEGYSGFRPGNSGALVVFGGVPVGILTDAFVGPSREAVAIRLDWVMGALGDVLPSMRNSVEETPQVITSVRRFEPFDISQLPSDFQEVVRKARRVRRQATNVAQEADRVKDRAMEYARQTQGLPQFTVEDGVAWWELSGEKLRTFRGQAKRSENGDYSAAGYGTIRVRYRPYLGNMYFCILDAKGCDGIGTVEYSDNKANEQDRVFYKGPFTSGKLGGVGHIKWRADRGGTSFVTMEMWGDPNVQSPVVVRSTDGRWYEGQHLNRWNGMGVVWDSAGQVLQIGTWRDGQTVENVTGAWRAGTYVPGTLPETPLDVEGN